MIRAIAEDALSPSRVDVLPWHDEIRFEDDLTRAVQEIADDGQPPAGRAADRLLDSAPPALAGRLAAAPRFSDHA